MRASKQQQQQVFGCVCVSGCANGMDRRGDNVSARESVRRVPFFWSLFFPLFFVRVNVSRRERYDQGEMATKKEGGHDTRCGKTAKVTSLCLVCVNVGAFSESPSWQKKANITGRDRRKDERTSCDFCVSGCLL